MNRAGWEKGDATKLLITLGEQYIWPLHKLIQTGEPAVAHYLFARIFENTDGTGRESGIHKRIIELEFGQEMYDGSLNAHVTPTAARIGINLDGYDRLRSVGQRGDRPYPSYTRLEG